MPGLVTLDEDELARVHRVKLLRLGLSPTVIDEMSVFDTLDLLEIDAIETYLRNQQLAKLVAVESAKIMARTRRR